MSEERQIIASFTIKGEPVSKARARFTGYGSKSRAYTPEKTRTAETAVGWAFRQAAGRVGQHPDWAYEVEADFYAGTRQRRDVDNMLKLIFDGLNGVAWLDDNQVIRVSAAKHLVQPADARTEVRVYRNGNLPKWMKMCEQCGVEFEVDGTKNQAARQFCSSRCSYDSRGHDLTMPVPCKQCRNPFVRKTTGQVMCSPACRSDSVRGRNKARATDRPFSACEVCGAQLAHRRGGRCRACWLINPHPRIDAGSAA